MRQGIVALIVGLLFGLGLALSGMTQPQKVIGFLDFFGEWDPTLLFVMVGAILVHAVAYRFIKRRSSPILAEVFHLPPTKKVDWKLIAGSVLFGIGWGLAGYCPGPALTSLTTLRFDAIVFVAAMAIGMLSHGILETKLKK